MDLHIRAVTQAELRQLFQQLGLAFGGDGDDDDYEHFRATAEIDRTRCAFDGKHLVGTLGTYPLDLTLPGGSAQMAGTTWVTVLPTHRRRGILSQMMTAHFQDARERGEPVAGLWASEAGIYGRFGYGMAASSCTLEIDTSHSAFRQPIDGPGTVRMLNADEAAVLLPPVFEATRLLRPGSFARTAAWWEHHWLPDPKSEREGGTRLRFAVYERDDAAIGYAIYRTRHRWPDRLPGGTLMIYDLQALDAPAEAALWRFALDVDLIRRVQVENGPIDSILHHLLADSRQLSANIADGLWLRPIDVPEMLSARRYGAPGRLVFEITDAVCPWNEGRFELDTDGARSAECKPSAATPDLRMSAEELGAVYLGGTRPSALARVGRVEGSPDALRQADFMFSWDPMPWCSDHF